MLGIRAKLATLRWYAARPTLYREAARRLIYGQISTGTRDRRRQEERELGRAWCESVVSPTSELCAHLGIQEPLRPLGELFPEAWSAAKVAADTCPVPMGGPANVDMLHHLVAQLKCRRVLETGVASGWSSLAILLALRASGGGKLVSIDMPYPKRNNEAYVGCVVPAELRDLWTLVRRSDRDALEPAIRDLGGLDLAHYDSDKSDAGRRFAYPRLWSALREGGVLMSDDVEDTLAFRDFASAVERKPWVLQKKPGNFAGILIK